MSTLNILLLILWIAPIILFLLVQHFFKKSFEQWSFVPADKINKTGAQIAQEMLYFYGLTDINIEEGTHAFSDSYNPKTKTITLEPSIYRGNSVTAHTVACHECGHALQHNKNYLHLKYRNAVLPFALAANRIMWIVFFLSLASLFFYRPESLSWMSLPMILMYISLACLIIIALFQLITLPIEFDASKRALKYLEDNRILSSDNLIGAKKVLKAAALTYIIAFITSLIYILRYVLIFFSARK